MLVCVIAAPSTPGGRDLSRSLGRYTEDELTALAEGREELRELKKKSWVHVRLIDMQQAYDQLPYEQREAVLLCGYLGLSSRVASPIAGVSHATVAKRYASGLKAMAAILNGG